jgi:hypothetical protein
MKNDSSRAGVALSRSLRDRAGAARPTSGAGGSLAVAYHESAHCIAGRFLGFEIAVATITPSQHFGGSVRGPGCNLDESPADIIADARARCEEAVALMPCRGEPREDCGAWSVHATSRCIELLAGKEVERLSGFDYEGGAATDMALADIYAGSVCVSAGAVAAFLAYCTAEAREILRRHWYSVERVAEALLEHGTLNGQAIDELIFQAEASQELEAEHKRRAVMTAMRKR